MGQDKIRIGYIGTGQIGQFLDGGPYNGMAWRHAKAAKEFDEVEVFAGSSRKQKNVDAFCREWGAPHAFTDYRDLLALPELDLVVICTPCGTHADIIVDAARAGKHVIVEKPIDVNLAKIDAAIAACREAGVKLQVGFGRRFAAGIRPLKQAIDEGKMGRMALVHATCQRDRPPEYFTDSSWRGTWAGEGGGCLMNQGSHVIDLMLYLCGDVESVTAVTKELNHPMIEVEDTAAALLKFENGAVGAITATTATSPDIGDKLTINGTRATVTLGRIADCWQGAEPRPQALDEQLPYQGCAHILRDVVAAIREDREPVCPGEEGRRAVELILACYESSKRQAEVTLPLEV